MERTRITRGLSRSLLEHGQCNTIVGRMFGQDVRMGKVQTMNATDGYDKDHHLVCRLKYGYGQNGSVGEAIPNTAAGQIEVQTDLE